MTVKLPIHKHMLNMLLQHTGLFFRNRGQEYFVALYQALFATAYYGLFRVGELTYSQHSVKACDMHIADNKKKILFVLRSSKTHVSGQSPQLIKIKNSPLHQTSTIPSVQPWCPYLLLRTYLHVWGYYVQNDENFFVFGDKSPVHPHHFALVLKHILQSTCFDSSKYSSHAFHAGQAGDLLKYGLSVETIKKLGRWKSNVVYRYLRDI